MSSAWKSAEEGALLDEDIDLLLESQEVPEVSIRCY